MSDKESDALEDLADWLSGLGFRMLVYVSIMIFTLFLMFYGNALYEQGILTEGLDVLKFGLGTIGIVATLMMLSDLARGISYLAIHATGRHRAYLVVGLIATAFVAFKTTGSAVDYGQFTDAYYRIVWAFSILVGFEFARAGILESDIRRLREVVGI